MYFIWNQPKSGGTIATPPPLLMPLTHSCTYVCSQVEFQQNIAMKQKDVSSCGHDKGMKLYMQKPCVSHEYCNMAASFPQNILLGVNPKFQNGINCHKGREKRNINLKMYVSRLIRLIWTWQPWIMGTKMEEFPFLVLHT